MQTVKFVASYRIQRRGSAAARNIHNAPLDVFTNRLLAGPQFVLDQSGALPKPALAALRSDKLCEYLTGDPFVKPFYDWDKNVETEEDIRAYRESELDALEGVLERLHPDAEIVLAERSGYNAEKKIWKISLRAFVQGVKIRVSHMVPHIKGTLGDDCPNQLDVSVYKAAEQLLGCVGCYKTSQDTRLLRPLDEPSDLRAYVVQDVEDCELLEVAEAAIPLSTNRAVVRMECSETTEIGTWLASAFDVDVNLICLDNVVFSGKSLTVPTRSKACPFRRNPHSSNHVKFAITQNGVDLQCYDEDCKGKSLHIGSQAIPNDIRAALFRMWSEAERKGKGSHVQGSEMVIGNITEACSDVIQPAQPVEPATDYLSTALNCELGTEGFWSHKKTNGKQGAPSEIVFFTRPNMMDCLQDTTYIHDMPGTCDLCVLPNKKHPEIEMRCGRGTRNVSRCHHHVVEIYNTYHAKVQHSGTIDLKVTKVKDQEFQACWDTLVDAASTDGLLRGESDVYQLIPEKPCCYVPSLSLLEFVQTRLECFPAYVNSPRAHDQCMNKIRTHGDARFPLRQRRLSRSWIGVSNGLVYLGNPSTKARELPRFIPFAEVPDSIRNSVVVRHYIDQPITESTTPVFDAMVSHQFGDPEIVRYFKAFIGRLLFPVKSDGHQVALMIKGVGRTGKSTVIEAVKSMVGLADIASFSGEGEKVFGIGGTKLEKSLIIIDDLPADTQKMLSGTEFQAMVTGGIVDAKSKNKDARTVGWTIPFCIATNVWPNWADNDGSIVRRVVTFFMENALDSADPRIATTILNEELSNLLWACVNAYYELLLDNPLFASKQFYDACPAYFHDGRLRHISSLDRVNGFFLATPEELRKIIRGTEDEPLEWWQYEVELCAHTHENKVYGSSWTLVQEAFEAYRSYKHFRDVLLKDHPAFRRYKLKVVEKDHFYSYQDGVRKKTRHVVGLKVTKTHQVRLPEIAGDAMDPHFPQPSPVAFGS